MEFWGVEVVSGKALKVRPEEGTVVHISQASLGSVKGNKGETVPLYVKVGEQKLVLGTLATDRIPQLSCDLVFDKEFELSHNWGKGSVYFVGYKSPNFEEEQGGEYRFSDSESEEEEIQGMDVDDEEKVKQETPNKPESSKKRANEAAPKTPVSAKKAKPQVTPVKTEEKKKSGHPATPHPAKKGAKTPTAAIQSPKSASQVSCGSCKKSFNSNNALESHNKAKHAASAR